MSTGPAPTMLTDWFTWGGVLFVAVFVAACVFFGWLTAYILTPKRPTKHVVGWGIEYEYPVSPCATRGHYYVSQPVVWRCQHCGDTRVAEEVYDQSVA